MAPAEAVDDYAYQLQDEYSPYEEYLEPSQYLDYWRQGNESNDSLACIPYRRVHRSLLDDLSVRAVIGVLYGLVWLLGVSGNALVLTVLIRRFVASRWGGGGGGGAGGGGAGGGGGRVPTPAGFFSVRFVFVGCLTCADLLTSLSSLPLTSITLLTGEWVFPAFACKCQGLLQGFSIFLSSFAFSAIAVDRYLLVCYPNRQLVTATHAAIFVVAASAASVLLASPMAVFTHVVQDKLICGQFCLEQWPRDSVLFNQRTYGLFVMLLQLGLPTAVTSCSYLLLSAGLNRRGYAGHTVTAGYLSGVGRPLTSRRHESHKAARRRRVNLTMALMVAAFVLAWLPSNILNLIRDFALTPRFSELDIFTTVYAFAHLIAMTTLIVNPILYSWYNKTLRDAIKETILPVWLRDSRRL